MEIWRRENGAPDECPEGFTADNLPEIPDSSPPRPPEPKPAWETARHDTCAACELADECWPDRKNKPCHRNNALERPNFVCPEGRWGAEAFA